jgi:hypothetical protein
MAGTPKLLYGPAALSSTLTTNIYVPASALVYDVVRHIHVTNKTSSSVNFSIWLGATGCNAAGTELFGAQPVAAYSSFDWPCYLKLTSTTYLVGGASAATSLAITIMGESYVV